MSRQRGLGALLPKRHAQTVARRLPPSERTHDGIVFHSRDEMARWIELRAMQRVGLIRNLRRQVAFHFEHPALGPLLIRSDAYPGGRRARYTADFVYEEPVSIGERISAPEWREIVEERKTGPDDAASRLRRAIFEWLYGTRVRVTSARNKARIGGKRARWKRAEDSI